MGNNGNSDRFYSFIYFALKSLWMVTTIIKLKDTFSLGEKKKKAMTNIVYRKQRHHFANKVYTYTFSEVKILIT